VVEKLEDVSVDEDAEGDANDVERKGGFRDEERDKCIGGAVDHEEGSR